MSAPTTIPTTTTMAPPCWDCGHEWDDHAHGGDGPCGVVDRDYRQACPCTLYMRDCMGTEVA